jgi:DNA-binding response OmpR family regulator
LHTRDEGIKICQSIRTTRQKLKAVGAEDLIETLYGQGYRLNPAYGVERQPKPLEPSKVQHQKSQAASAALTQIWQRTQGVSRDRVAVLERAVQALSTRTLDTDLRQQAAESAHKLLGSLGTFGLTQGSHLAQQLEALFLSDAKLGQTGVAEVQQLVTRLRQEIEASTGYDSSPPADALLPPQAVSDVALAIPAPACELPTEDHPLILIVNADQAAAEQLAMTAYSLQMRSAIAPTLTAARDQIRRVRPDAVVLDLDLSDPTGATGLSVLAELNTGASPVPTVVFTNPELLIDRLAVARLGGRGFLSKSTPPMAVLQTVQYLLQHSRTPEAKILAIDDDPQILHALTSILEPWGMQLTTLAHPTQF